MYDVTTLGCCVSDSFALLWRRLGRFYITQKNIKESRRSTARFLAPSRSSESILLSFANTWDIQHPGPRVMQENGVKYSRRDSPAVASVRGVRAQITRKKGIRARREEVQAPTQVLFASFPNTHARVHGELISIWRGSSLDNLVSVVVAHGNHAWTNQSSIITWWHIFYKLSYSIRWHIHNIIFSTERESCTHWMIEHRMVAMANVVINYFARVSYHALSLPRQCTH